MRIGLLLETTGADDPLDRFCEGVDRAAADGFASVWTSQVFGLDALTAIALAGARTPGIELGTGVVPIYPRHAATLAQQALTVQSAIGGRLALGIGLSHKPVVENMWGYSFDAPAQHMDEYLSVLQSLLVNGEVSVDGESVRAHLTLSAPRTHPVPVLLAALGPRMLRLAGEQADGTVLWMTGPATTRDHIVPTLTRAAENAGRPSPRVVCALPVCVTDDPEAARAHADELFAVYGHLPSYRAMLDREGARGPGDVAVVGDEDTVRARIAEIADAGATDFVAAEFGDGSRTRALLRTLAAPVGAR